MPAWQVEVESGRIARYDVCALYGERRGFLAHAILCDEEAERTIDAKTANVHAVQMGPPLRRSITLAHVVATASLSDIEKRQIKSFVDDRLLERKAHVARLAQRGDKWGAESEYTICPHARAPDGDVPMWRFSCTGFVIQAYAEAGIVLLSDDVPSVTLETVKEAYSWAQHRLSDPVFRAQMGIGNGESWPVVFVGYVIHSLSRDPAEIRRQPYRPISGNEFYPALPKNGAAAGPQV